MPYDDNNEYEEDASFYNKDSDMNSQIHPNDSYSDRFTVSSRQTFNSKPKPAITTGTNHVSNKDKIFSKKHSGSNYGGSVDMATVARAAAEITKKKQMQAGDVKDQNPAQNGSSDFTDEIKSSKDTSSDNAAQSSVATSNIPAQDEEIEKFRSSGLDSLFSSTSSDSQVSETRGTDADSKVVNTKNQNKSGSAETTQPFRAIDSDTAKKNHDTNKDANDNLDTGSSHAQIKHSNNNPYKNNIDKSVPVNPAKVATEQFRKLRQERKLQIVKPLSYNTAKEISSALAAGDAVVVVLTHVYSDLAKRILDFSFGAASMCGARVNVEGNQVYAFTIGQGLTQRERLLCVKQGVMLNTIENENEQ